MSELLFGLSVMAIGLLIVFAGLVLLIYCIRLITFFSNRGESKNAVAAPETAAEETTEPEYALSADTDEGTDEGVTPETIAAITAAIAALWQEDTGFIVRRVRRVRNAAAWNLAGRDDQVYGRM
jgi:sodium pump decarboxylase gamma subunit